MPCRIRTRLLVDLDGSLVGFDSDDFAYKVVMADTHLEPSTKFQLELRSCTYKLVHGTSDHVLRDDDGPRAFSR